MRIKFLANYPREACVPRGYCLLIVKRKPSILRAKRR